MEHIFHEKQEGALCAQHCLNALLQGPYYTAVDLAVLANQLDEDERRRMAEGEGGGAEADAEYQRFLAQPSANMDDTGFFSLQVLTKAIEVWGLDLINLNSSDARAVVARRDLTTQSAYICNYREHWFTIRKLGLQWFDLNSLLRGAALITNTYLHMFIAQLQTEGYSIYVVCGDLPDCVADQILVHTPAVQQERPRLLSADEVRGTGGGAQEGGAAAAASAAVAAGQDEDAELRRAMELSLAQIARGAAASGPSEDDDLDLALQLSQSMMSSSSSSSPGDGGRRRRRKSQEDLNDQSHVLSEEDDIQRAIQMSLQSSQKDRAGMKGAETSKQSALGTRSAAASLGAAAKGVSSSPSAPKSRKSAAPANKLSSAEIGTNIVGLRSSESQDEPSAAPARPVPHQPPPPSSHPSSHLRPAMPRSPMSPPTSSMTSSSSSTSRHFGGGGFPPSAVIGGERLGGSGQVVPGHGRVAMRQSTPDLDEVRQRRLAFLEKMDSKAKEDGGN